MHWGSGHGGRTFRGCHSLYCRAGPRLKPTWRCWNFRESSDGSIEWLKFPDQGKLERSRQLETNFIRVLSPKGQPALRMCEFASLFTCSSEQWNLLTVILWLLDGAWMANSRKGVNHVTLHPGCNEWHY